MTDVKDTQGKTVFYLIQYKNVCLASSDLFYLFARSIKFYPFHYHSIRSTNVLKM